MLMRSIGRGLLAGVRSAAVVASPALFLLVAETIFAFGGQQLGSIVKVADVLDQQGVGDDKPTVADQKKAADEAARIKALKTV